MILNVDCHAAANSHESDPDIFLERCRRLWSLLSALMCMDSDTNEFKGIPVSAKGDAGEYAFSIGTDSQFLVRNG